MTPEAAGAFSAILAICLVGLLLRSRKGRKGITVTDYMRGVHFAGGRTLGLLSPGYYRFNPSKESILTVDLRPQPILIERVFYRDSLNRHAVISAATELSVSDPALAATKIKDQVGDSFNLILATLRDFVSHYAAEPGGRALEADLTAAINAELSKIGMKINPVEIIEFWVAPFSQGGVVIPLA